MYTFVLNQIHELTLSNNLLSAMMDLMLKTRNPRDPVWPRVPQLVGGSQFPLQRLGLALHRK